MTSGRIKQICLVHCLMASLLVGSASACACSHHHEVEVKPEVASCHHQPEMTEMAPGDCLASDDDCVCAADGQTAFAKAESLQLKKHIALAAVEIPSTVLFVGTYQTAAVSFVKPTYLSDSFYELPPSRGPPARL